MVRHVQPPLRKILLDVGVGIQCSLHAYIKVELNAFVAEIFLKLVCGLQHPAVWSDPSEHSPSTFENLLLQRTLRSWSQFSQLSFCLLFVPSRLVALYGLLFWPIILGLSVQVGHKKIYPLIFDVVTTVMCYRLPIFCSDHWQKRKLADVSSNESMAKSYKFQV